MRFCFILASGLLAGFALQGADAPPAPKRSTSVVRTDPRSGRLVRSVIVTSRTVAVKPVAETVIAPRVVGSGTLEPPPAVEPPPTGIDEAVERIAAQYSLKPDLLHSVIKVESNYNPYAVSSKGAQGLMQLIPATARRFGVDNVFNPVENIQGGARYLRYLLDLYNWNLPLALAAYNAGEAAVAKYGGVPPYPETQNYLVLVKKRLDQAAGARKAQAAAAKPVEAPRDPSAPARIQEIVDIDGTVRYVSR
jgi:soluble lytic murein transglycosylase-like protein